MIKHLRTSSVRHHAIMLVLRSENVGGPVRRSLSEGRFTDIVSHTSLMDSDEGRAFEIHGKGPGISLGILVFCI